jgi:hypothetical protein
MVYDRCERDPSGDLRWGITAHVSLLAHDGYECRDR